MSIQYSWIIEMPPAAPQHFQFEHLLRAPVHPFFRSRISSVGSAFLWCAPGQLQCLFCWSTQPLFHWPNCRRCEHQTLGRCWEFSSAFLGDCIFWCGLSRNGASTVVTAIFGGILQNEVNCLICGTESRKFDPFLGKMLPLVFQVLCDLEQKIKSEAWYI